MYTCLATDLVDLSLDLWADFLTWPQPCSTAVDLLGNCWVVSDTSYHCWTWPWNVGWLHGLTLSATPGPAQLALPRYTGTEALLVRRVSLLALLLCSVPDLVHDTRAQPVGKGVIIPFNSPLRRSYIEHRYWTTKETAEDWADKTVSLLPHP